GNAGLGRGDLCLALLSRGRICPAADVGLLLCDDDGPFLAVVKGLSRRGQDRALLGRLRGPDNLADSIIVEEPALDFFAGFLHREQFSYVQLSIPQKRGIERDESGNDADL